MKVKNLLKSISELLDADRREQLRNYDEMKKILKKLKKKSDKLQRELEESEGEAREKILRQLEILTSQRKKGIDALREIKALRDRKESSRKK